MAIEIKAEFTDDIVTSLANLILEKGNQDLLNAITQKAIEIKKSEIEIYYTIKETSKILKVSVSTLRKTLMAEDHIEYTRFGGGIRFSKKNITDYYNRINLTL